MSPKLLCKIAEAFDAGAVAFSSDSSLSYRFASFFKPVNSLNFPAMYGILLSHW
jgi:hypothetical protein